MHVLVMLADGFEEVEALTPTDILRRAGADATLVSITNGLNVVGAHGISVKADVTINEANTENLDAVILPGGGLGTENLAASDAVKAIINKAVNSNAVVAAICAAPSVLGRMGLLDGKEYACYPSFEKYMPKGIRSKSNVAVDGKIITAAGMGVSVDFALAVTEKLYGKECADKISNGIIR